MKNSYHHRYAIQFVSHDFNSEDGNITEYRKINPKS